MWRIVKYLVVRNGGPVSREVLADTFWRSSSERTAIQNVYATMHEIRRTLAGPDGHDYVTCERGSYALAGGTSLATDLGHFEARIREGERADRRQDPQAAIRALEAAAAAYVAPVLEDEPYERWAEEKRLATETLHVRLLEKLAELLYAAGEPGRAVECHQTILAHDSLRETSHRALIRYHAGNGRRAQALRQYRELERTLQKELGIGPDPQTRELIREMTER